MDTKSIDLLSLQTRAMQGDLTVRGMSAALTPQLLQASEQIINELIYTRIDKLPESVLDILAWQFNVEWYEPTSSITEKRRAINDALIIKRTQGTPAAVQRVIEIYFGDGRVEEWFDYEGDPGYFRVITNNRKVTGDQIELFTRTLESVKNIRSRLDEVIVLYFSWDELDAANYTWDVFDALELTWDDLPSWEPIKQLRVSIALTFSEQ